MLKFPYQEAVGALMWTTTMISPDIAHAVRTVTGTLDRRITKRR